MTGTLPFEERTDDEYSQRFVDACSVAEIRRGYLLTGPCPRCTDSMEFELPTGIFLGTGLRATDDSLPVMCTCKGDHPGRPNGDEGCGAYWTVTKPENVG